MDFQRLLILYEDTLGIWDTTGFTPGLHHKSLKSKRYEQRLRKMFQGISQIVHVYVTESPYSKTDIEFQEINRSELQYHQIPYDPNAITYLVIGPGFTKGASFEFEKPPTPWIIAHRLAHALPYRFAEDMLDGIEEILEKHLGRIAKGFDLELMMTTRSARTKQIPNEDEMCYELFAQYCRYGTVKLVASPYLDVKSGNDQDVEAMVNELTSFINQSIEKALKWMVGRVFFSR